MDWGQHLQGRFERAGADFLAAPCRPQRGLSGMQVRSFPGSAILPWANTVPSKNEGFRVKAYRCGVAWARGDIIRSISSGSDGNFALIFTRPLSVTR